MCAGQQSIVVFYVCVYLSVVQFDAQALHLGVHLAADRQRNPVAPGHTELQLQRHVQTHPVGTHWTRGREIQGTVRTDTTNPMRLNIKLSIFISLLF